MIFFFVTATQVVSEEFEKLTGNSLEEVAKALGLQTEQAMMDSFGIDLPRISMSVPPTVVRKPRYNSVSWLLHMK